MKSYFVNDDPQPNGDHEVHEPHCLRFPEVTSFTPVGAHADSAAAVRAARRVYPQSIGCKECCVPALSR